MFQLAGAAKKTFPLPVSTPAHTLSSISVEKEGGGTISPLVGVAKASSIIREEEEALLTTQTQRQGYLTCIVLLHNWRRKRLGSGEDPHFVPPPETNGHRNHNLFFFSYRQIEAKKEGYNECPSVERRKKSLFFVSSSSSSVLLTGRAP